VWEWCADWYRPDYFDHLAGQDRVADNPQGPADSLDPAERGVFKRVMKGGSYLCTDQYCTRYMPGGRGKGEPDTGTNHVGFRCAKDAPGRGSAGGTP
jgi:formylglycine-generating enzyme required for sulfatase activity